MVVAALQSSNKVVIDINQNSLGVPAAAIQPPSVLEIQQGQICPYWAGRLSNGVVVAFARASGSGSFSVNFGDMLGMEDREYDWQ